MKDKPKYIRNNPWMKADRRRELDRVRVRELRTLPAVDRLVGDVIDALKETGRLQNTIVVFTSDNGVLWGEHRWDSKDVPYEESIAVPLIVRYDAVIPEARTDANLITNLDFAPTFAEAAGATTPFVEGASFLPLLLDPALTVADRLPDRARGPARGQRRSLLLWLPHEALRPRPVQRRRGRALRSASRSLAARQPLRIARLRGVAGLAERAAPRRVRAEAARPLARRLIAEASSRRC